METCNNTDAEDFELNYWAHDCAPTLIPSRSLEKKLDITNFLTDSKAAEPPNDYAVHIHAYHIKEFKLIARAVTDCCNNATLLISTDSLKKKDAIENYISSLGSTHKTKIRIAENKGRNIMPLIQHFYSEICEYDLALHLHTKKSDHFHNGREWLNDLLECLLGSDTQVRAIRRLFHERHQLGLIMPRPAECIRTHYNWGNNLKRAQTLPALQLYQRQIEITAPLIFPAGMMFWFKPSLLKPIREILENCSDNLDEPLENDGTILHTIERVIAHICEQQGQEWLLCSPVEQNLNARMKTISQPKCISVWSPMNTTYEAKLGQMSNELRRAKIRLAAIENSASWKLTWPLRAANMLSKAIIRYTIRRQHQ